MTEDPIPLVAFWTDARRGSAVIKLQAESHLHGAALALRRFAELGVPHHGAARARRHCRVQTASSRPYSSKKWLTG